MSDGDDAAALAGKMAEAADALDASGAQPCITMTREQLGAALSELCTLRAWKREALAPLARLVELCDFLDEERGPSDYDEQFRATAKRLLGREM